MKEEFFSWQLRHVIYSNMNRVTFEGRLDCVWTNEIPIDLKAYEDKI